LHLRLHLAEPGAEPVQTTPDFSATLQDVGGSPGRGPAT